MVNRQVLAKINLLVPSFEGEGGELNETIPAVYIQFAQNSIRSHCERVVELPLIVANPLVGCAKFSEYLDTCYDAGAFSV
jgi:hypothetical protein